MSRRIGCVCIGLWMMVLTAQAQPAQFAFRIGFKDKTGTADIHQPLSFLSQKSLDRRAKYNIAIDSSDLPVSPAYLDSVKQTTSGIIHTTSRWLNSCVLLVEDSTTIQTLRTKPFVTGVEWVGYFPSGLHDKPSSPIEDKFNEEHMPAPSIVQKTTGSAAYYGATWNQTSMVNGDCLHDKGWKGENMLIAVLDNGFNYVDFGPAFDSLYHSGRIIDHYNIARDTNYIFGSAAHGTEVLSVLAGYLPNYFVGAAPLADYALYITEDAAFEQPIETDNLIAGIERADSIGADVMSISLGYNTFNLPFPDITPPMLDGKTVNATIASNMAMKKGILMVLSAGNEGGNGLLSPGDADSALTVGNVNASKLPAGSTGQGPNASGTIKPNVCGMGDPAAVMRWNMDVGYVSGTSTATPSIAGFAACLLQGNPGKHPYEIRNMLQQTGHVYNNPTPQLGYGVPDFCMAATLLNVREIDALQTNFATITPNPFSGNISLTLHSTVNETAIISLYDLTGNILMRQTMPTKAGTTRYSIDMPSYLKSGLYFLKIQTAGQVQTVKLIKQ